MRATSRAVGAAAVLAVVGAASLTACGDDVGSGDSGGDRASRFAAELEAMPGVASAEVEEEVVEGEGIEQLDVGLVVEEEATEEQVTALLDAVHAYDADLGFDQHHSLTLLREGDEVHDLGYSAELEETTAEVVRRWALAEERLDPQLDWSADGYGVVTVTLAEDATVDDVTALAEEIGADADLAALPLWTLVADGEETRTYFATEDGMTAAVLGAWSTAVGNLALGPADISLSLAPQNSPGGYESDPPPPGSMRLEVEFELPGVTAPGQLTPERWGDRLWPLLRAQLDVVRELPPSSQFAADHFYTEADGTGGGLDQFLYVTDGKPASREEPDRGWNVAAARYLAGG